MNRAINAIRAFAAFLVVLSHLRALFFVDFADASDKGLFAQGLYLLSSLGHQAVIVFFVLSGFWVGGSVVRGVSARRFSLKAYGISRLSRLWIVAIPAIVLTQGIDRVGAALHPDSAIYQGSRAYHTVVPVDGPIPHLDWLTTLGNVFFVQSIHVSAIGTNTPLWSLAFEFWYYLLFPALLITIARGSIPLYRLIAFAVLIAGVFFAGVEVLLLFPTWLLGAVIAWRQDSIAAIWRRLPRAAGSGIRIALVSALLGTAAATVVMPIGVLSWYVLAAVSSLLLAAFVTDARGRVRRLLAVPSWAAEWSYSLYAIHLPVLALVASFVVPQTSDRWQMDFSHLLFALLVLTAVLASAFLFYLVSEKHTNRVRSLVTSGLKGSDERRSRPSGSAVVSNLD